MEAEPTSSTWPVAADRAGTVPGLGRVVGFYVCRLGFAWSASRWLGLFWVWMALLGDCAARALVRGRRFRSGRWKLVPV
jgi:Na+-driven multidrug efflux pump